MLSPSFHSQPSKSGTSVDTCEVCKIVPMKYVCSSCRKTKFCSASCNKVHLQTCTSASEGEKKKKPRCEWAPEDFPAEDRVSIETLRSLGQSAELKALLQNENLRNIITTIDICDEPDEILKRAVQGLDFQKFAAKCLEIAEPESSKGRIEKLNEKDLNELNEKEALEIFTETLRQLLPQD